MAVTVTLRAERRMAGETRIGGGDPNKNPDWAPRPDMDYTDKVCPFTSGVWGAVFPSEQERMHPITHRVERVMAMGCPVNPQLRAVIRRKTVRHRPSSQTECPRPTLGRTH